jgi:hypothetical protein
MIIYVIETCRKLNFKYEESRSRWQRGLKAQVYDSSLAEVAGSSPVGGMDICLLWMLGVVQVQISAMGRSLVRRSPTKCVCVTEYDQVQQ